MDNIELIIGYNYLYDDTPLTVLEYLKGIRKESLLTYSISYCHDISNHDVFYEFVNKDDKGTDYYERIVTKVNDAYNRGEKIKILNNRTSLHLLELILSNDLNDEDLNLSDIEIRERLLKAYLLLNDEENSNGGDVSNPNEPIENLIIKISLRAELYKYDNLFYYWLAQIIKSIIFFQYAEQNLPKHLEIFLSEYNIKNWSKYIVYIHQITVTSITDYVKDRSAALSSIIIDPNDSEYDSKKLFIEKFCVPINYEKDEDFTALKSMPIFFNKDENKYDILFLPFFVGKIYSCLYFIFKDINNKLIGTSFHINEDVFRIKYGLDFSEKHLLNIIMGNAFKGKYKHLGAKELKDKVLPDYYIRNGNKILLIENKDNLILKGLMDKYDTEEFIDKLKQCFIESYSSDKKKIKIKAIKQLSNNICNILNGKWKSYDPNLKEKCCVIYPIIVVHHKEFTLSGINSKVNGWFKEELSSRGIDRKKVKNVTIIDIDTLIVYQGLLSESKNNIFNLIDEYWNNNNSNCKKKYSNEYEVINSLPGKYKSFDKFIYSKLNKRNIFTRQIKQYYKYLE